MAKKRKHFPIDPILSSVAQFSYPNFFALYALEPFADLPRRFQFLAKSRTIAVRLLSMAMTGYYRTMIRPRTSRPLSMMKYDPVGEFFRGQSLLSLLV